MHKSIEVAGGHIELLLNVNKMVFTNNISIVSFTPFLAFVVQTAYVLHFSETLARKRSVFNISSLAKYDHMVLIYQPPNLVICPFLHYAYADE